MGKTEVSQGAQKLLNDRPTGLHWNRELCAAKGSSDKNQETKTEMEDGVHGTGES